MNRYLLALSLLLPAPVFGAWGVIDNFDGLSTGAFTGVNGWTADTNWNIVAAPTGGIGNAAAGLGTAGNARAYKSLSLAIPNTNNATTLFFRVYRNGAVNISVGLSDEAAPALFGGYETQLNAQHNGTPTDSFKVRDAGAFDDLGAGTWVANTWYNIWMVVNNAADTYQMWIDAGNAGTPVLAATHIGDPGAGDFDFVFRNGTAANALGTFVMAMGASTATGTMFVDDIYVDTSGQNLTNPTVVPEPASCGLAAMGALVLAGSRRRRTAT